MVTVTQPLRQQTPPTVTVPQQRAPSGSPETKRSPLSWLGSLETGKRSGAVQIKPCDKRQSLCLCKGSELKEAFTPITAFTSPAERFRES